MPRKQGARWKSGRWSRDAAELDGVEAILAGEDVGNDAKVIAGTDELFSMRWISAEDYVRSGVVSNGM